MEALRLANRDFSFSLYSELTKTETGNIFYSPFSIHAIMFMASVGAASKTFDEIIATIHLNRTTPSLEAYKNLLEDLISENDNLKIATGMFVDSAFNVEESFVENCKNYLKSTLEKLNFKNDSETQRQFINNWVLNNTNNKISELFEQGSIKKSTVLILANAVHFKCNWAYKFNDVYNEPFYLTPKNQVTVQMMSLRKDLNYYHDDNLQYAALQLPYEGDAYSLIILLPDTKDGLLHLEKNILKIKINELMDKMRKCKVDVKLPRFKIEQSLHLKEILSKLGCPTMFTNAANFSKIVKDEKLHVSEVVHKAYIDVDEKGTEAAAATGIIMKTSKCLMYEPNPEFIADHPFIIAVISRTKYLLFLGRLSKP